MSIVLEQVSKHYGGLPAVNDLSLDIGEGEFFVLLGPSGSGKSTLLRAIAGLTTIDHGRILLRGRDVSNVSAREREVGFVFQHYALFRHMSVADNIEFALRARRVSARQRRLRRAELLKLVSLEGMDKRLPSELSGGQQQRVAVARALAHEPRVLLLDEPFGALDARIRDELRRGIREIQRAVGITTVLVTHDQDEAFAVADRIGVMDRGRLHEVGEPRALYARPRTRFVATFLGAANLLLGHEDGNGVRIGETLLASDRLVDGHSPAGSEVTVIIRPEDVAIAAGDPRPAAQRIGFATVRALEFAGSLERIRLSVETNEHLQSARNPAAESFVMEAARHARGAETLPLTPGQRVSISARRIHVLPTRISSLRLAATAEEARLRLEQSTLVRDLAERMHITPSLSNPHGDCDRPALQGLQVIALEPDGDLSPAVALLQCGANQVLAVGASSYRPIERMLIYAQPSRPARDGALSVAGSLLRHLNVDATLLVAEDEREVYGPRYRDLLDLREASLRLYGADVRTGSFHGMVADALERQLRSPTPALLVIGLTSTASGVELMARLAALASRPACAAVLLVSGHNEAEQRPALPLLRRVGLSRAL